MKTKNGLFCPHCNESRDDQFTTTQGVLPPELGCATARCSSCGGDFYYNKLLKWSSTLGLPKDSFSEENPVDM